PAPFGPMKPKICPRSRVSERHSRAVKSPYFFVRRSITTVSASELPSVISVSGFEDLPDKFELEVVDLPFARRLRFPGQQFRVADRDAHPNAARRVRLQEFGRV